MSWRPLLQGSMADRALTAARAMASDLVELGHDPSVAGGSAGVAVFYAYLNRIDPGRGFEMLTGCYLARALAGATRPTVSASLYRGATGVAWAAAHLQKKAPLTATVEQALAEQLSGAVPPPDHGLTDGLVGYGVYARERLGEPGAARRPRAFRPGRGQAFDAQAVPGAGAPEPE